MATAVRRERAIELIKSGDAPLDFMLAIMRDQKTDLRMRFEAAKAAAPYIHPRLVAIDATSSKSETADISDVVKQLMNMSETEKLRRVAWWIHEAAQKQGITIGVKTDVIPG